MTPEKNQSSKRLQSGFVENLNGAVRENPMAAALIGVGVSWMFFRGSRITDFGLANASQKVTGAVDYERETYQNTDPTGFADTSKHHLEN